LGARPQFIKSAPVSRKLIECGRVSEVIIHTGQHYDVNMSDIFFNELSIPKPHYNLGIAGVSHGAMTGRMLEALERTFVHEKPDWVLVYGDTNSTLAAALAASKLHIRVAHVEAGLRSFNRSMPEEINRILTDHCSDILFTPTAAATKNLFNEGIRPALVFEIGDVMQDATILFEGLAQQASKITEELELVARQYILATIHRQENTDDPARLAAIIQGLSTMAEDIPVVLPLHPRTRSRIEKDGLVLSQSIRVVDPLGFFDMLSLEKQAALIATDSGGVQKEAYFQRVPCITLRDETEWIELVETGWNRLCPPTSADDITAALRAAIGTVGREVSLYGQGRASDLIVERLLAFS
jgi:UDP-GlcNAc3NAcA epimerase